MPRTPLRMPKMSMTMETGELGAWHVAVGDEVEIGQVVCEVMTDKIDMEVESTAAGTVLELVAEPGDIVPVGEPMAWLDASSESLLDDLLDGGPAPDAAPAPDAPAPEPGPEPEPEPAGVSESAPTTDGITPAIPRARRLAAENDVDLRSLTGTGPGGAVLVSDVRTHLDHQTVHDHRQQKNNPVGDHARFGQFGGTSLAAAADGDAMWAARAAALAPRPSAGGATTIWRDVVLPGTEPPAAEALWAALLVALAAALAQDGPPRVRQRPRVGLAVPTPAGPVTVTFSDLPAEVAGATAVVSAAAGQVRGGTVDVGLLAPPDAVLVPVTGADRVAPHAPDGPLLAVGVGDAARRVVVVGDGIGIRTVVTLGLTAAHHVDPHQAGRILAGQAAILTQSSRS